jgi:UDP-glucose 4-epimerase
MKVLVTGGAGFIGSHIVDLLVDKGYDVVVVDNVSTGKNKNLNEKVKFYQEDITSEKLRDIFEKEKPLFVIHQAAQASARVSIKKPVFDESINVEGTINLLECCKEFNIKKIVYASSAAVYGNPEQLPIDESHSIKPISQYGASKYSAELFIRTYYHLYNIDFAILRYSNVYGPRQDAEGEAGVVAIFINALLNNKQPQIFGDGDQTRDFVYVTDVALANLLALEKTTKNKVFNISTGKKTSINELFQIIKDKLNSSLSAEHTSSIPGDIRESFLNCSLSQQELGWKAETDINEGIKNTVDFFKGGQK